MENNNKNIKEIWILSGRYKIIEQIGIGGMSYVYKAIDKISNDTVAIKILKEELSNDDEFIEKFKSEALASENIHHPNVVGALNVVDDGKLHYIVLEYVDGVTLNKFIKDNGILSNEETIKIAIEVASGLLSAHKQGIIHRDIKPQNIIINKDGMAKIMDFGIARAVSSTTRNISIVGTVHYISPEQARNENIDYRSDIYSLGCTMYEMITGTTPFQGENPVAIIVSHIRENLPLPSEINKNIYKSLEKIILKCTQMLPKDRYQNMNDLISDLNKAIKDKQGNYISDVVYNNEIDNQTMVISDKDMQLIKDMSKNYQENDSKRIILTDDQKKYIKKYIKKTENSKKILYMLVLLVIILSLIIVIILLYNNLIVRHNKNITESNVETSNITTNSSIIVEDEKANIVFNNLKASLPGLNIDDANKLVNDYGININVAKKEFSDKFDNGIIIKVLNNNLQPGNILNVLVSMGKEILDFSNIEKLNKTKMTDMEVLLKDRELSYSVVEQYDRYVPLGNIIGVNKTDTSKSGSLIFTVSLGIGDDIVIMPNLYNKSIEEVEQILAASRLSKGQMSYMRNNSIAEGKVVSQSVEAGKEISIGSSVDLTISTGAAGNNISAEIKEKWVTDFIEQYIVTKNNIPINAAGTVIIAIRLMQTTNEGTFYTELTQPTEYREGTTIPLVFVGLEGIPNVTNGSIQIVDVENDRVITSYDVEFKKE